MKYSIKLIIVFSLLIFLKSFALTYTVKPGDNLEKIAKKFGVSVKELKRVNHIKNPKRLRAGQKIKIPVKHKRKSVKKSKSKTKKQAITKRTKRTTKKAVTTRKCRVLYKVKPGESLILIAKKFKVKVSDLKRWNNLRGNTLRAGQLLCIRPVTVKKKTTTQRKVVKKSSSKKRKTTTRSRTKYKYKRVVTYYKVRRGDSLWKIAKKFNTTVSELKRLNNFRGRNVKLYAGRKIKVPKTVRVAVKERKTTRTRTTRRTERRRERRTVERKRETRTAKRRESRRRGRLQFIYPVQGRIIKGFVNSETERHVGIDIKTRCGEPIRAVEDGKVIYAGDSIKTFGNLIIIRHRNRYNSVYGHVGQILVREGQRVRRGDIIGRTGTLNQKGCGLYFEIRKNTIPINPLSVLGR